MSSRIIDMKAYVPDKVIVEMKDGEQIPMTQIWDLPYKEYLKFQKLTEEMGDGDLPKTREGQERWSNILSEQVSMVLGMDKDEVQATFSIKEMGHLINVAMTSFDVEKENLPEVGGEFRREEDSRDIDSIGSGEGGEGDGVLGARDAGDERSEAERIPS